MSLTVNIRSIVGGNTALVGFIALQEARRIFRRDQPDLHFGQLENPRTNARKSLSDGRTPSSNSNDLFAAIVNFGVDLKDENKAVLQVRQEAAFTPLEKLDPAHAKIFGAIRTADESRTVAPEECIQR